VRGEICFTNKTKDRSLYDNRPSNPVAPPLDTLEAGSVAV